MLALKWWQTETRGPVRVPSHFSRGCLFATLWTVARQVPLAMELSKQNYWSGLPRPSPGDLPDPGIAAESPALQAESLPCELPRKPLQYK